MDPGDEDVVLEAGAAAPRLCRDASPAAPPQLRAHLQPTRTPHQVLTPERTRGLRAVWVFDCDIAVHPSVFPLGQVVGLMRATRATVLQPAIRAQVHGTYHTWLRVRQTHPSCVATTAGWVEMQTPIFSGDAWARLHEGVFALVPDAAMSESDFGLDLVWCAFLRDAFPSRPACLVTPAEAATHLNSHAIERYMTTTVKSRARSCAATCIVSRDKGKYRNYQERSAHILLRKNEELARKPKERWRRSSPSAD